MMTNDTPKNLEAYKAILEVSNQDQTLEKKQNYWKSYLLSFGLPPSGIYYFIKYFFFVGEENARKAAVVNLLLTLVSLFLSLWMMKAFFTQSQFDSTENSNIMKELITPENQKALQDLLR